MQLLQILGFQELLLLLILIKVNSSALPYFNPKHASSAIASSNYIRLPRAIERRAKDQILFIGRERPESAETSSEEKLGILARRGQVDTDDSSSAVAKFTGGTVDFGFNDEQPQVPEVDDACNETPTTTSNPPIITTNPSGNIRVVPQVNNNVPIVKAATTALSPNATVYGWRAPWLTNKTQRGNLGENGATGIPVGQNAANVIVNNFIAIQNPNGMKPATISAASGLGIGTQTNHGITAAEQIVLGSPQAGYGLGQTGYGSGQPNCGSPQTGYGSGQTGYSSAQTGHGSGQTIYGSPQTGYGSGQTGHGSGQPNYGSPQTGYGSPQTGYGSRQLNYGLPQTGYDSSQSGYGSIQPRYGSEQTGYGSRQIGYGGGQTGYGAGSG